VEDELSNKVALTVAAGDGPDECNKEEIGTIGCGSGEGIWTVSGESLVDVVGTIASS